MRYGQVMQSDSNLANSKVADFTLMDQAGKPWHLSEHLDAAVVLVFLRGDW